jgi:hypothetical protein
MDATTEERQSKSETIHADENATEKLAATETEFAALGSDAKAATDREHAMTLREGIRKYPKAIAWSVLLSLAVVMEGYGKQHSPFGESFGQLLIQDRHGAHILVLRVFALQQEIWRRVRARQIPSHCTVAEWAFEWGSGW